jgi:hypothetical protein
VSLGIKENLLFTPALHAIPVRFSFAQNQQCVEHSNPGILITVPFVLYDLVLPGPILTAA